MKGGWRFRKPFGSQTLVRNIAAKSIPAIERCKNENTANKQPEVPPLFILVGCYKRSDGLNRIVCNGRICGKYESDPHSDGRIGIKHRRTEQAKCHQPEKGPLAKKELRILYRLSPIIAEPMVGLRPVFVYSYWLILCYIS